jgi:adenylylsulfate kinase
VVVWITGFSGAGKTTLARAVSKQLCSTGLHPLLLDGDEMRAVLGEESGVSHEERRKLSHVYSRLARLLSEQGFLVIVATISMFEEVRRWNRDNNKQYIEVYLRISQQERELRDAKGLYKRNLDMVDNSYEEPWYSDFCFDERTSLEQQARLVTEKCLECLKI